MEAKCVTRLVVWSLCLAAWTGCGSNSTVPSLGSTPTAGPTAPTPTPGPRRPALPPVEFTAIEVGDRVTRTIAGTPPECVEFAGWPCQYFEFVAPRNGTLEVIAIYATGTQRGQPIDITLDGPGGQIWAQTYLPGSPLSEGRLNAIVMAGERYRITLWYTFVDLHYELRTSLIQS